MSQLKLEGHKLHYHPVRVGEFASKSDCFPIYAEISPVGRCNHRCVFCAYDHIGYPDRQLETERAKTLLKEMADAGLKSILFAGEGEPLLHKDIAELVAHAKKCGLDVGMFTNGSLLNRDLAESLLPNLTFLRFSFNGGTAEKYAEIHKVKPEIFDRVLTNMKTCADIKKSGGLSCDLGVQFVCLPENKDTALSACEAVKECGVDYFSVKPFVHQSDMQGYKQDSGFNKDDIADIFAKVEALGSDEFYSIARKDAFFHVPERHYSHCFGTSFITVIDSGGNVCACLPYMHMEEFQFGNIYESTFEQIWLGERRAKILKHLQCTLDTASCPLMCRPDKINDYLNDILRPDVKHINFI